MNVVIQKMQVKEFWSFIDETQKRLEDWVRKNKADINYECCGFACNVFYRILSDWKILERCGEDDIDDVMRITCLKVRGVSHDVMEFFGSFFKDPTHMQFNPPLTKDEYSYGYFYDNDKYDCEPIFTDDEILKVCKEIRPELYEDE